MVSNAYLTQGYPLWSQSTSLKTLLCTILISFHNTFDNEKAGIPYEAIWGPCGGNMGKIYIKLQWSQELLESVSQDSQ